MSINVQTLAAGEKVTEPGAYRMSAERYHAGPCDGIEFSNSIAHLLITQSALHGWSAHPKLGGITSDQAEDSGDEVMDIGSVVHKLVLKEGSDIAVLDFPNFRTKASQLARDAARLAGKIPCLAHKHARAAMLAKPIIAALESVLGMPIDDCLREVVVCWKDHHGLWRKAMIDVMRPDGLVLCDVKSTQMSVAPTAIERRMFDAGLHRQNALYVEGLDAIDPDNAGRRRFFFIFGEQSAPHAISPPIEVSEAGLSMAADELAYAGDVWAECLETGEFPAFGTEIYTASPPGWVLARHEERMTAVGERETRRLQQQNHDHKRDMDFAFGGAQP